MNILKSKFHDIFLFFLGIIFSISVTALAECSTTISSNNVTYGSSNTNAALASLISTASSINTRLNTAETNLNTKAYKGIDHLEFTTASTSSHGGYIDFHYGGSTSDFTSRIIEDGSGQLDFVTANGIKINSGNLLMAPTLFTPTASIGTIAENRSFHMGSAVFINFKMTGVTCNGSSTCVIATIPTAQRPADAASLTATIPWGNARHSAVRANGEVVIIAGGNGISNAEVRIVGSYLK